MNMKKLAVIAFAAVSAFSALPSSDAQADVPKVQIRPGALKKIFATKVTGTINVSVPSQLAGLSCSDITVFATSTEMLPAPPGGFATQHKWTRQAQASGASLGACSYTIYVPGNSSFNLSLGSDSTDQCMLVSGYPTPNAYVNVTVPTGTTKTYNFAAGMSCQNIH